METFEIENLLEDLNIIPIVDSLLEGLERIGLHPRIPVSPADYLPLETILEISTNPRLAHSFMQLFSQRAVEMLVAYKPEIVANFAFDQWVPTNQNDYSPSVAPKMAAFYLRAA